MTPAAGKKNAVGGAKGRQGNVQGFSAGHRSNRSAQGLRMDNRASGRAGLLQPRVLPEEFHHLGAAFPFGEGQGGFV